MDPLHGDRLVGFRSLGERTFHEERLDRSATSARTWWRTGMRTAYSTSRTMSHRPGKCQTCICHSRQFETHPGAYYEPMTAKAEREPVHPQVVAENGPDSVHFQYVHHATVTPVALDWKPEGPIWKFLTGWPNARSANPDDMALRIHSWLFGLGGSVTAFEGVQQHRLTFTVTPVDHGASDLFYTVWWPRLPGDESSLRRTTSENASRRSSSARWRTISRSGATNQRYVENPALARQDARPYRALRKGGPAVLRRSC